MVLPCKRDGREQDAQENYGCQDVCNKNERETKSELDGSGCRGYACNV